MVLSGENQNTWRKTCLSATLYTTNPTWIGLGLKLNLCGDRPTTYCLSLCMYKIYIILLFIVKMFPYNVILFLINLFSRC